MEMLRFWSVVASFSVFVTASDVRVGPKDPKEKRTDLLMRIRNYKDLENPPNYDSDKITVIEADLNVNSFDSINEASMDFKISVMLHLRWINHLITNQFTSVKSTLEYVEMDATKMGRLWVPDLYFPNEKRSSFFNVMTDNKMMRLHRNGTVDYTTRLALTLSCPMNLERFPFDKQTCSIKIESFGYTTSSLQLRWSNISENAVALNQTSLPQFEVTGRNYSHRERTHRFRGNFSYLQADFHLERNIGYYMIQMYIPSLLIVLLSWVSFWLNVNSVPARISLGVLSVLTITTQSSAVNASLPRVSYIKAIDIWMTTCLVFVFAALIEFSMANVLSRNSSSEKEFLQRIFRMTKIGRIEKEKNGNDVTIGLRRRRQSQTDGEKKDLIVNEFGNVNLKSEANEKAEKVEQNKGLVYASYLDIACRVLFPAIFAIFNIIYWVYFWKLTVN